MLYLLVAFSVTWLVIFFYLLFIARQQRRLSQELDTLKRSLQGDKPS